MSSAEAFDSDDEVYVFTKGERAWSASDLVYQVTHVMPLEDIILHELDHRCVCGPTERGLREDWEFYQHHALFVEE